nr:TerC family protein [Tuberibacillus sp. Marseille-P3662]
MNSDIILAVINIILIDIILGGDNAVVIAMACRKLPSAQRNKAIFLGSGIAVILRIFLTAVMMSLMQIPYLLLVGGGLLIFIAFKLLIDNDSEPDIKSSGHLFTAVKTIVFADLVMGLDNILGIAGASHGDITLVVFGLLFSVPIIIWGSKLILTAIEHVPGLLYIGGGVLAYTASGMITGEPAINTVFADHPQLKSTVYVAVIVGVLLSGWIYNQSKRYQNQ